MSTPAGAFDVQMIVGVLKESYPGERRVALVPAVVKRVTQLKLDVLAEPGAGTLA